MAAQPVNLKPRIPAPIAVMQLATESVCECAPVKVHLPLPTPSCVDTDGAPASAPDSVQFSTALNGPTNGGVVCQRDWSKARLNNALPKGAGFETSSSFPVAQNLTPNIWPISDQAGNGVSSPSGHGATRTIAPTAILTACWSSSGRTLAIAESFPFMSPVMATCRVTAQLRQTLRRQRPCSIASKATARRPAPTTDIKQVGVAA